MKKNALFVTTFLIGLVLAWPVYSKIAQTRRNAAYRAAIAPFERDLQVGMTRTEVKKYLDSHHVSYYFRPNNGDGPAYQIEVGEVDDLICEWHVYIALEFSPGDALKLVHIRKEGTCL